MAIAIGRWTADEMSERCLWVESTSWCPADPENDILNLFITRNIPVFICLPMLDFYLFPHVFYIFCRDSRLFV